VLFHYHQGHKSGGYKMKTLYSIAGLTKQAHQQYMVRTQSKQDRTALYIELVEQARMMHPVIGLEKVYYLYKPEGIGRDSFINIATLAGYALDKPLSASSKGQRVIPYQNLLTGKDFTGINQVWATDITYYLIGSIYYYISMIMDLYSRKIIACAVADSLHAVHSIKLLKQALKQRALPRDHGLIHHSDKGSQYTSLTYTQLLKKNGVGISMCNSVYENTAMERLNGIIKNSYLTHWDPKSFSHLKSLLKKAVNNYNHCPHGSLAMLSPLKFEQQLPNVALNQRMKMKVYTLKKSKPIDPNQLVLFDKSQLVF